MELAPSYRKIIDLQNSRIKRLRHRARHTQTFWTAKKTYLVTLTYRPGVQPMKEDWSRSLQRFRKWYKAVHSGKKVPQVLWVRELTKAGKLHYHAVINGEYPGKWDVLGIWPHGMSQVKKGEGDTCTAYLLKYASKLDSKLTADFKHWRLYGFVGLSQEQRRSISYQMLPEWIRTTFPLDKIKSPSERLLYDGRKLQSGWTYGGAAFAARLPRGFDSIVYLGYCALPPVEVGRAGGVGARSAPPPPGACYF